MTTEATATATATPAPTETTAAPAPAAPAPAPAETTTLAGTGGSAPDTTPAPPETSAPDWRAQMAGGDADAMKRLGRFTDPAALYKSYRALEARMSSGEMKRALPDNPSAEELATWRKENGLPENEQGYVSALKLPDGLVIGEADKPLVEDFAKHAHGRNWTPAQFNEAVSWYYDNIDKQRAETEAADATFKQQAEDTLRTDWQGPDYRRNLTAVNNLIATFPGDLGAQLLAARTPDGRLVGDNPLFIKQLAQLSFELNPAASLVPAGTSDMAKGVDTRIAELRTLMQDRKSAYYRGPDAQKLQSEYRDLLAAQDRMKSRAA